MTSSSFHEVLDALLILYPSFVNLPDLNTPLASRIADDGRFFPWFKDCLGALDGTHITAYVDLAEQPRYRNRKGVLSQNVLAVCDFDLKFVYRIICRIVPWAYNPFVPLWIRWDLGLYVSMG